MTQSTIKFFEGFVSKVPAECLVEDYQTLQRVLNRLSCSSCKTDPVIEDCMEDINTVMECIAEAMDRYTEAPECSEAKFMPSPSSIVALGYKNGVVGYSDGTDIHCMGREPVSKVMSNGVVQCKSCEHMRMGKCCPEKGRIRIAPNVLYDGSSYSVENFMKEFE